MLKRQYCMDVMNLQSNMNADLLTQSSKNYPYLRFTPDINFYWSPQDKSVHFNPQKLSSIKGKYSLIHEVAHGLLGHISYNTDYELLSYEVAAWDKAVEIAHV